MEPWRWVGDRAILRTFDGATKTANPAARALAARVGGYMEVEDVVPGAASVLVTLRPGAVPGPVLVAELEAPGGVAGEAAAGVLHEIAVTYAGEDLESVSRFAGMTRERVVQLHSSADYTVAFVGFSPGFGYLLGLPERLRVPRLDTPRTRVPAGSVAIADEWSAVYPSATPGGWRLLGRTDAVLFDAHHDPPALLQPGDRVRFVPR